MRTQPIHFAFAALAAFSGLWGCGGTNGLPDDGSSPGSLPDSGGGGLADTGKSSSGLPGGKRLIDLTDTEKGQLCDWMVGFSGGYGHTADCGTGMPILNYPDRAACVKDSSSATATPNCAATVKQLEDCLNVAGACLEAAAAAPVCAPVMTC